MCVSDVAAAIHEEGLITRHDRQWSSMLQVLALSTVIQAEIRSVYPASSYETSLYSGTVLPILKCNSLFTCLSPQIHPVIIFWSGSNSGDFFVPNHIVIHSSHVYHHRYIQLSFSGAVVTVGISLFPITL